ncbi:MAG: hypothetical protein IJ879_02445 [Muribaculaceae bacterium]|nr:hypothetical protein [Muribaculaceae bacterium]
MGLKTILSGVSLGCARLIETPEMVLPPNFACREDRRRHDIKNEKDAFSFCSVHGLHYFACGEDRRRLNNAQEKTTFSWHCVRLALSLWAKKP